MVFLRLLALLILATMAAPENADQCQRKCGNVSIPYPFGTTPGCYHDKDFLINCTQSIAYIRHGNVVVTNISMEGQLYVLGYVAHDCYNLSGGKVRRNGPSMTLSQFTVSHTENKFIAVGCDTYAYIRGNLKDNDHEYGTGCISVCSSMDSVVNGSCSGIGCCQTNIPKRVRSFHVSLSSYNNHTNISNFNLCSFGFVVQNDKFNFSSDYIRNITDEKVPVVLDWAIGNVSCDQAKANRTSYACKVNSTCHGVKNGPGYRCICNDGYEGNPYTDGCHDIDECKNPDHNECVHNCINTPGNYTCSCRKGYDGDGWKNGSRCTAKQLPFVKIVLCTSIIFIVFLVCFSWLYFGIKKRNLMLLKEKFFRQNGGFMLQKQLSRHKGSSETAKIFSAEELKRATNNYDESRIIGRGGYGTVYKGILANNQTIAIKKSKVVDQSQIEQFINEVVVLSQINHRNVVKLLGCCLETQVPLLVYEFITNGTLFDHIHDKIKAYGLSWDIRLRIAMETAGVLSYLHSSASTPIIHRDIKPTNILLDDNYTAKVSDFGASRLVPMDQDELSTIVQGTLGYLDPEYLHTNQLNEKSDVYSFGVVLVELLTGKKALCFKRPEEERNLAMYFVSSLHEGRLFTIIEEQIMHEEKTDQLMEVAKLAKRCLSVKGEERPSMKEVTMELEGLRIVHKHSWANVDLYPEESECLLAKTPNHQPNACDNSIINECDSIKIQAVLALDGGR